MISDLSEKQLKWVTDHPLIRQAADETPPDSGGEI
jgi:hypothetical protein